MTEHTKPEWAQQETAEPELDPSPPSRPAKPAPGLKARPPKRDSSTMILLFIAGMVAIGDGGFGRGGAGDLTGGVTGTVQTIDGSTLTLLLSTGTTVTIDLSGSTTYHNETAGSSSDVKVGSKVQVQIGSAASAGASPNPSASGGRTLTASDILVVTP